MWWKELGKLLRNYGYLNETKSSFNQFGCLIQISDKAEKWLKEDKKVEFFKIKNINFKNF
jgi:hypothetical protein